MIEFEECIKLGLLKRIPPSKVQADEQLKKANILLEESKKSLNSDSPNSAVITAYAAVLDAARALLFRDGYREKSHACVVRYLEAKYSNELGGSFIQLFDEYRDRRHKTMYSGDYYPTSAEAKRIVSFAEEFVGKVSKLLK
ncbi:MAG: HEPN domain-containing protein [Candidatus Micrarchaeota archaeon]